MENACDPGGQSGDTYLVPIHFYQATPTHLKGCIIIETMVEASIYGKVKCFRGRVVFMHAAYHALLCILCLNVPAFVGMWWRKSYHIWGQKLNYIEWNSEHWHFKVSYNALKGACSFHLIVPSATIS